MRITQHQYTASQQWMPHLKADPSISVIFLFGSTDSLQNQIGFLALRALYPKAVFFGCSTAGEVLDTNAVEGSMVATTVAFEHSHALPVYGSVGRSEESFNAGVGLGRELRGKELVHVFLVSDGLKVDVARLLSGLLSALPEGVAVTGGLAGDGARFDRALVINKHGVPVPGTVAALGFYGQRLKVNYASRGGWLPAGPEGTITRSKGGIVHEIDGAPALDFYKQKVAPLASGLPSAVQGLYFPFEVRPTPQGAGTMRMMLSVNEDSKALSFAGPMPEKSFFRVMKAGPEQLVAGASAASEAGRAGEPELALLVSCMGRKFMMGARTGEELAAVKKNLGPKAVMGGFYSYGELAPHDPAGVCEIHNQTMTVTTFEEK